MRQNSNRIYPDKVQDELLKYLVFNIQIQINVSKYLEKKEKNENLGFEKTLLGRFEKKNCPLYNLSR